MIGLLFLFHKRKFFEALPEKIYVEEVDQGKYNFFSFIKNPLKLLKIEPESQQKPLQQ